jgi:hypothetical protein
MFGTSKGRLGTVFVALTLLPVVFSLGILWLEEGSATVAQLLAGTFECSPGHPCQPMTDIFIQLTGISALLSLFALAAIFLSRSRPLDRLTQPIRIIVQLLIVISVAALFRYVSGFIMPLVWLPVLHDYLIGIPASQIAPPASWIVVFPLVLFICVLALLPGWKRRSS